MEIRWREENWIISARKGRGKKMMMVKNFYNLLKKIANAVGGVGHNADGNGDCGRPACGLFTGPG